MTAAPAPNPRILVILGPTAGGKSELAASLAERFGGEVISADSMQVYRRLNAATAKPSADLLARAPHHLIDIVEPTESFTVADWRGRAESLITDLHARGRLPIVVGGTNLYFKALLEGMFEGPPADESFRRSLDPIATADLWQQLAACDSSASQRIHRNDRKRIIRALEVHHTTGRPISEQQSQWSEDRTADAPQYLHNPILIGLHWPTPAINRRINERVRSFFNPAGGAEGLIEETARLEAAQLLGPQARQALGTKQALDHLAGRLTRDQALEKVKIETRRYARNQRTWLKRYRAVHWLDASALSPEALLKEAARIAAEQLASGSNRPDDPDSSAP